MVNVHVNTLGRWERGEQYPSQPDICNILKIRTSINPTWLLTGEGPMERSAAEQLPVSAGCPVDCSLMEAVIAAVEDHLAKGRKRLAPDKKAKLITILYDIFAKKEEKKVDKAVVVSLFELAA